VSLLVLRHVDAGDRQAHAGPDRRRPASARGRTQAVALVDLYADRRVVTVATSPYTRCVQSVEPLAAASGVPITEVDELGEGTPPDLVLRTLRRLQQEAERLGGDAVACSHGDVIGDLVRALAAHGVAVGDGPRWPKASTWVLDGPVGAALDGAPERLTVRYLPPPA
jgi:broad specificity phosphatase PhoE